LDWRRLAGENQKPIPAGVAGKVDQNVYLVGADQVSCLLVGQPCYVAPLVREAADSLGDGVGTRDVCVAEYFDLSMIMCGQQRQKETADRVLAKVGRDVPDS
jgi:hypothetical protein